MRGLQERVFLTDDTPRSDEMLAKFGAFKGLCEGVAKLRWSDVLGSFCAVPRSCATWEMFFTDDKDGMRTALVGFLNTCERMFVAGFSANRT